MDRGSGTGHSLDSISSLTLLIFRFWSFDPIIKLWFSFSREIRDSQSSSYLIFLANSTDNVCHQNILRTSFRINPNITHNNNIEITSILDLNYNLRNHNPHWYQCFPPETERGRQIRRETNEVIKWLCEVKCLTKLFYLIKITTNLFLMQ